MIVRPIAVMIPPLLRRDVVAPRLDISLKEGLRQALDTKIDDSFTVAARHEAGMCGGRECIEWTQNKRREQDERDAERSG